MSNTTKDIDAMLTEAIAYMRSTRRGNVTVLCEALACIRRLAKVEAAAVELVANLDAEAACFGRNVGTATATLAAALAAGGKGEG